MDSVLFHKAITRAYTLAKKQAENPRTFTLSIKKKFDQCTILDVYCQSFPHKSQEFWEQKIGSGNLTVDGKSVTTSFLVRAGQISKHTVPPKPEPEISTQVELLHANSNYWVINKPSPIPVHSGGRFQYHTLTNLLQLAFPEKTFHLINRLDANTTGIVLVALNKSTAQLLYQQFKEQRVTKTYLALVSGTGIEQSFTSTQTISKEKTSAGGRKIAKGYASETTFYPLAKTANETLLKVIPRSGRTNQIRLHLAHENMPIVGDLGYANPSFFEDKPLTYPTDCLFLHAWKLTFFCPVFQKNETFTAPPNAKWGPYLQYI